MYHIKNNTLYYLEKAVVGADLSTLRILNINYAQDALQTYCQTQVVSSLDAASTEVLNEWVIRDRSKVLLWGRELDCGTENLSCLPHQFICSNKGAFFQGRLIAKADVASFQVFDKHYSKDKQHIYYTSHPIEYVDYASFEVLGFNYARDKNHLYYGDRILQGVDRASFSVVAHDEANQYYSYARDKHKVYYENGTILYADPKTFSVIKGEYAKDQQHVYRFGHIIHGALPDSFHVLNSEVVSEVYLSAFTFSADKNSIFINEKVLCAYHSSFRYLGGFFYTCLAKYYYIGKVEPLTNCDAASFALVGAHWAKDKHSVYHENEKIPDLDPETFQTLGLGYYKDHKQVFFQGELCEGVDAASFSILDDIWAADKNSLVFEGVAIEHSSPSTLKQLSEEIYADDNKVYYWHRHYSVVEEIEGADPNSFAVIDDSIFAKDKQHVYYSGERIPGAEPESFEVLEYYYSQDKQAIYSGCDKLCDRPQNNFKIIESDKVISDTHFYTRDKSVVINRATFEVINHQYCKDDKQVIYQGNIVAGADPSSFEVINPFFAKDKHRLYSGSTAIDIDVNHFKIQDSCYALDTAKVYFIDELMPTADAATFTTLEGNFAKDSKQVYYREGIVEQANPQTFQVLNYSECKDDQFRFYFSQGEIQRERLIDS